MSATLPALSRSQLDALAEAIHPEQPTPLSPAIPPGVRRCFDALTTLAVANAAADRGVARRAVRHLVDELNDLADQVGLPPILMREHPKRRRPPLAARLAPRHERRREARP